MSMQGLGNETSRQRDAANPEGKDSTRHLINVSITPRRVSGQVDGNNGKRWATEFARADFDFETAIKRLGHCEELIWNTRVRRGSAGEKKKQI
jgi:hypothetical protein